MRHSYSLSVIIPEIHDSLFLHSTAPACFTPTIGRWCANLEKKRRVKKLKNTLDLSCMKRMNNYCCDVTPKLNLDGVNLFKSP